MCEKFGFTAKNSTQHQLLVAEVLCKNFNKKIPASITFLKFAKAFNNVWHE